MQKFILIGIGGFLGAMLRFIIKEAPLVITSFPLNILIINFVGTLLLAFFLTVTFEYRGINPNLRMGIVTGFFGALTTFSTLCKDSILLLINGEYLASFLNVIISIIGGLLFAYIGFVLAREIINRKGKQYN